MKRLMKQMTIIAILFLLAVPAYSHCEIPCGIYGDSTRIELIREHVETIEKSMTMIDELSKQKNIDYNQLVRWVINKEEHAEKIQDIATQYFMFQRVKPANVNDKAAYQRYTLMLDHLHRICVSAMKCKQSTDKTHTKRILINVQRFETLYFGVHEH